MPISLFRFQLELHFLWEESFGPSRLELGSILLCSPGLTYPTSNYHPGSCFHLSHSEAENWEPDLVLHPKHLITTLNRCADICKMNAWIDKWMDSQWMRESEILCFGPWIPSGDLRGRLTSIMGCAGSGLRSQASWGSSHHPAHLAGAEKARTSNIPTSPTSASSRVCSRGQRFPGEERSAGQW